MKITDIVLLLLSKSNEPIIGTTRLQKLLFLLEKEKGIHPQNDFEFIPYKFGPASKRLYDDIEFLLNMGYIEKSNEKASISDKTIDDIINLKAEDFLSSSALIEDESNDDESVHLQEDDCIVYRITKEGISYLKNSNLLDEPDAKLITEIRDKYNRQPLQVLLKYVYIKYPDYTSESVIKDEIL